MSTRISRQERATANQIERLQVHLAAQQRQLDNTSPNAATIANILEQMECDRVELSRLRCL